MTLKWWEKTVEYYFVSKFFDIKMFVSPLDGKEEERAGDVLLGEDGKWILIEFKREKDCLKTEEKKFNDYQNAKKNLSGHDNHHFLIYGAIDIGFCLKCKTYFSREEVTEIPEIFSRGIDLHELYEYLDRLSEFKQPPGDGGGGGYGQTIEDFSLVAGINNDGNIVECMSISEFESTYGAKSGPEPEHTNTMSFGGPSM